MNFSYKVLTSLGLAALLSVGAFADTATARYDNAIQTKVADELAKKKEFKDIKASVEDGIVTLTGDVNVYQQKLNAANKVRKADKVQGVRNLIEVSSNVPDSELAATLNRKLYYDRIGYDNVYNYVTVSVKDGVAVLVGETKSFMARDSAVSLANSIPGVKEVVDNIKVLPTSLFDDQIRARASRAIYGSSVLSGYATDPALPIRIIVDNGNLTLYGTVSTAMEKQVAGMKASQVFGVFSVQNNLVVAKQS